MAGYNTLSTLLTEELDQLFEEGRAIDKEAFRARISSCESKEQLMALYAELRALPMREDYPYDEPSELDAIEAQSDASTLKKSDTDIDEDYFQRLLRANFGTAIKSLNSFEAIAVSMAEGCFGGFDPYRFPEVYDSITRQDVLDFMNL